MPLSPNSPVVAEFRFVRQFAAESAGVVNSMQNWDPNRYAENVRFVSELGKGVVELLAPQPGERILDLGCGDGVLTKQLASLGCDVLGVDASREMVEATRAQGVEAQVMDGQKLHFENEFDAVFSNAALHWMKRPDAVIAGVAAALKPGGRFVAEFGGGDNVAQVVNALSESLASRGIDADGFNPWYFPSPEDYKKRLVRHGFVVNYLDLFERPTPLPGDVVAWLETFAQSFTAAIAAEQRAGFLEEVRENLSPALFDAGKGWSVDYVRLRFAATKM